MKKYMLFAAFIVSTGAYSQNDGSITYPAASGTEETEPLLRDEENVRFIPPEKKLPPEAGPQGQEAQEEAEDRSFESELDTQKGEEK